MQLHKAFVLTAIFWAEPSAAEDQNHRMLTLQLRKFSMFAGLVGQLIVGKDCTRNDIASHPSL